MERVNVYDSKNPQRVLGTMDVRWLGPVRNPRLRATVLSKVSVSPWDAQLGDVPVVNTITLDIEFEEKPGTGGWERQASFRTDARWMS